jgi:hypothetical protein
VKNKEIHQTPDDATGKSKLAVEQNSNSCPKDGGLWDIEALMRHVPICRRSVHNLRKKGLPTIVLGRRLFWHPASVEAWLMRQQRGGDQ